jgi:hypothetical protein
LKETTRELFIVNSLYAIIRMSSKVMYIFNRTRLEYEKTLEAPVKKAQLSFR